jgi:hypothetical protein
VIGLVGGVGLGDSEVQLTGMDGVDVVDGTAGGFDGAADAGLFPVFVHHPADGAPGGIVGSGDTTGSDGNELGTESGTGEEDGSSGGCLAEVQKGFLPDHTNSLHWVWDVRSAALFLRILRRIASPLYGFVFKKTLSEKGKRIVFLFLFFFPCDPEHSDKTLATIIGWSI